MVLDEEFEMGSVGPDDDDEPGESTIAFIPKQQQQQSSTEAQVVNAIASSRRLSNAFDVMENDTKLSYLIEDILPDSGLIYFGGLSGTGKTILAIQLVADIILGRPCMTWRLGDAVTDDIKTIMFSLEMNELELGERLRHMYPNLTDDQKKVFQERFITYSEPAPFKLWEPAHQVEFMRTCQASGAKIQLIDSASVSFGEELTNQAQVNKSLDFLRMIRARFNWAQVIVCHTRKPPPGIASNPAEVTLNELFGHSGVAQSASSIIIMMEDEKQRKQIISDGVDQRKIEKKVHIINCKTRFGANGGAFIAHLTAKNDVDAGEPLMFRRNAIPIEMTDEQRKKLSKKKGPDLKSLMADTDWGSALDGDE
jgi:RecA-family ATPase